jgi:hypothetical protein
MAALPKVTVFPGMGDTASSASGGGEVDVAVVQVRSGAGHRFDPPSGTSAARCSLHGAPQRRCQSGAGWAIFSPTCLPSIGNLVLVSTTPRGEQDRDQRAALSSGVLSAPHEPATDRCSVVLDAGLAPKTGTPVTISLCCQDQGRRSGPSAGPRDYGVRRARVGTHRYLQSWP